MSKTIPQTLHVFMDYLSTLVWFEGSIIGIYDRHGVSLYKTKACRRRLVLDQTSGGGVRSE